MIQGGKQGSRALVGTEGISVSSKPGTKKVCQTALGADARNNTREETAQKWTQELKPSLGPWGLKCPFIVFSHRHKSKSRTVTSRRDS